MEAAAQAMGEYPEIITPTDLRGRLAMIGLGSPLSRAALAGAIVGGASYCSAEPKMFFRKNGTARPWTMTSAEPDAMQCPFFLVPLTAAVAVYLFT